VHAFADLSFAFVDLVFLSNEAGNQQRQDEDASKRHHGTISLRSCSARRDRKENHTEHASTTRGTRSSHVLAPAASRLRNASGH
jgi:hypothetical protein